jgi:hypothetical protein
MKKKKKKEIVKYKRSKTKDKCNSVYMFHHIKHDLHLFINAHYLDGAMEKFDQCNFQDRKNWKIFLECGQQPA